MTEPTGIAFAPDGRVFVSEKSGLIKEFDSLSDTTPTTLVDLRTEVYDYGDRGLLGMTLDPQFPTRPYLYVLYTRDALPGGSAPHWGQPGQSGDPCPDPPGSNTNGCVVTGRLMRLTLSGNTVSTQTPLVTDWCQQYPSHSIGDLGFGADGALYASGGEGASYDFADWGQAGSPVNPCGDPPGGVGTALSPPTAEGGALRSQDARTTSDPTGLDGALLRLNPDTGQAMPGNPFSASPDANQRRIVAYGFRNPFRFAIRPGTNEVWVGDVGAGSWDEIDRLANPSGSTALNFGWPCYEGPARQAGFDAANLNLCESLYSAGSAASPYYTYNHNDHVVTGESCPLGGSAISGLAFYNGGPFPNSYNGALFFADYARSCIWVMFPGANGLPDPSKIQVFDDTARIPVGLTVGPGGDLFYPSLGDDTGNTNNGTIQRIVHLGPGNAAPVATATATPSSGTAPLTTQLDASRSTDPNGDTLSYAWDLNGDGKFDDSTQATLSHTYTTPGIYNPAVRVTDPDGASDVASVQVQAGNSAPTAKIDAPTPSLHWAVGDQVSFSGTATDAQETLPPSAYSWNVVLNHCPSTCHTHPLQHFDGVTGGSFPAPDHDYPSSLTISLTVTDSGGLTASDSVTIDPQTVQLAVHSSPPGVEIGIDLASAITPFEETVIKGSRHTLAAPPEVGSAGGPLQFASWSDGGAMAHTIGVSGNLDLGATYRSPLSPQVLGEATTSCAGEVPTIVGTTGNDRLVGTKGADVIAGLGGADKLIGMGGNDRLCGGAGRDVLKGGAGNDVLRGGPGSDLCRGGPGSDQARACERSSGI